MVRPKDGQVTAVPVHPCQWSPEVLDAIRPLIRCGERIHDPFAGTGLRLGQLCNDVGAAFTGTDIEDWPGHDWRVALGDSTFAASYPGRGFTIVTSPVYLNKRLADYPNGPLPTTRMKGRRDYGISLGRALHPNNLARHTGRPSRAVDYWRLHGDAVKHWRERAIVNVDGPIEAGWLKLLLDHGYRIDDVHHVVTQRYGGLDNASKRADFEVVIEARRG